MPKISKAQLLRALSAAEKTRPVHANPFQAPVVKRPHQLSGERALNELLVSSLAKGSLDLKKLKQIRDQHKVELRRVMEKEKRDAIKQAARARKILKARIPSASSFAGSPGRSTRSSLPHHIGQTLSDLGEPA